MVENQTLKSHKVMRSKIIKKAHKRDDFKLTSHNFLLCIRLERIIALSNHKFSINLNEDGRLYMAIHSGHGFNSENLQWFVDIINVFRGK